MPTVERKEIDALNTQLTVKISRTDYEPKFNSELKEYQKTSQIKGFRKGKAPMSFIKRSYGQGILVDLVNNQLQDEMGKYLEEAKLDVLGQPIPSEDQVEFSFDIKNLEDFEFKFDLGIAPDFEFKNVDEKTKIPYYLINVTDDMAREDLDKARRRMGKQDIVDADINDEDILRVNVKELDGSEIKEGGVENEFSIVVKDLGDSYKKLVTGKATGLELDIDIYDFEKDKDATHINKYLLGLEGDAPEGMSSKFRGTVTEIMRVILADLNEEFFQNYFQNDEIKDEKTALEELKKNIASFYEKESDTLLNVQLKTELRKLNDLALPDAFLKRWLVSSSEENTIEKVEEGYEGFANNLRWTLIQNRLAKSYEIEVSQEDIDAVFVSQVSQYLGQYANEEFMTSMITRLREDRDQVNKAAEQVVSQKIFEKLKATVKLQDKKVDMDGLREIAKEIYEAEA